MSGQTRLWWWCLVMVMVVVVMVKCDTHMEERVKMSPRMLEREMRMEMEKEMEEEEEKPAVNVHPRELSLVKGQSKTLNVSLSTSPPECVNVTLSLNNPVGALNPWSLILCSTTPTTVTLNTTIHGTAIITAHAGTPSNTTFADGYCSVSVMYSEAITTTADVFGWIYTIAWDISFLPQIIHNWRRKSVVGLSFDFLTFNFLGFFSYLIFNVGLFWIDSIKDQYEARHPESILHVRLNDVIFPLYALVCVALQITQCFFYKRGQGQRVSIPCRVLTGVLVLAECVGCLLVPLVKDWWWLDLLYLLSYVKLIITCVKYVPQLWVNHKSRSTEGWSIYQVILDFTGGTLSLVQMFMLSANYDDWMSILTDPAKLGLGLLSIFFNIFFFIQHYCLYRHAPSSDKELKGIAGPLQAEDNPDVVTKF